MKILYAAGPRIGAGEQMRRIINNLATHTFKISGYSFHTHFVKNIHWNLDFIHSIWHDCPAVKSIYCNGKLTPQLEVIAQEIGEFEPDICICDGEPYIAALCNLLNIELWYCSPLHLATGLNFKTKDYYYQYQIDQLRLKMATWPKANRTFIYSPFQNFDLETKQGYEWIQPYSFDIIHNSNEFSICILLQRFEKLSKMIIESDFDGVSITSQKLNNDKFYSIIYEKNNISEYLNFLSNAKWIFMTGETSILTDCLKTNKQLYLSPSLQDPETILNACIIKILGIGQEVGQIELFDKILIQEFNLIYHSILEKNNNFTINCKMLHEVL